MHLKTPDLNETYPAFILSEGKVDHLFIGKTCIKLVTTLDIINNYQSNVFSFDLWLYIRNEMTVVRNLN